MRIRAGNQQSDNAETLDFGPGWSLVENGWEVTVANGGSLASASPPAIPRQRQPKPTIWTAFQTGHGWTNGGTGGTWNLNDTSDFRSGSQCVAVVTDGLAGDSWVQLLNSTSRDLSAVDITVWVKVTANLANLKRIRAYLASDNLVNYANGNIYDGTFPATPSNAIRQGEWFPIRFTYQHVASVAVVGSPVNTAITGLRLLVTDNGGGGGACTVEIGSVEYTPRPATFPNGVVSLTFDDTKAPAWTIAAPYMAKYGYSGTEYAIVDLVGGGGSMTLAQLQALESQYGWEVAAHAYTVADHDAGFDTLSAAALESDFALNKLWLLNNGFRGYDHMAYPLGHLAPTDVQVGKYFSTGRTLYSNPLSESIRPGVPLRLRCYEVTAGITLANVQTAIDLCVTSGGWLILCFHGIVASGATGSDTTTAIFQGICDYLNGKTCEIKPVGDVWRALAV